MRSKNYRRKMKKKKDKQRLKIVTEYGYHPSAGYVDYDFVDGELKQVGKYIKYPGSSRRQKFYKKYSNRLVRRSYVQSKGNGYRKNFDYKWEID